MPRCKSGHFYLDHRWFNQHCSGFMATYENKEAIPCAYTANEVPQPQVLLALGLLKVNPLLLSPPCQSTSMPYK